MKLSRKLLDGGVRLPEDLKVNVQDKLPERILQFGEGNFLRGFVDWMVNSMNAKGLFNGSVAVVQPVGRRMAELLNSQDGLYTLYLRGIQERKAVEDKSLISCISRGIDLYSDFDGYMKCAENPDLRFVISNTTEAGIAYNAGDKAGDAPPASFPAKLTILLYRRFKAFQGTAEKGLVMIPCELIDRNGDHLKRIVLQYAREWGYEKEFIDWLEKYNYFLNSLVDRIVTGYPKEEAEKLGKELGYEDSLLDTAEIFHLWVIEGDKRFSEELPLTKAGLNVIWTDDMTPYRERKVRILNGAHTMTVLAAYLCGKDTVRECMEDPAIRAYMDKGIYEEIIPTLDLPASDLKDFAAAVGERFANPFIKHYLLSISLNSTSKFKARVLPSIKEYIRRKGKLPKVLTFSMAALIAFYRGDVLAEGTLIGKRGGEAYKICDALPVLEFFRNEWAACHNGREEAGLLVSKILSRSEIWGEDLNSLPGFTDAVSAYLFNILACGMDKALRDVTFSVVPNRPLDRLPSHDKER